MEGNRHYSLNGSRRATFEETPLTLILRGARENLHEAPLGSEQITGANTDALLAASLGGNNSDKIYRNAFVIVQLRTFKISITIVYYI